MTKLYVVLYAKPEHAEDSDRTSLLTDEGNRDMEGSKKDGVIKIFRKTTIMLIKIKYMCNVAPYSFQFTDPGGNVIEGKGVYTPKEGEFDV